MNIGIKTISNSSDVETGHNLVILASGISLCLKATSWLDKVANGPRRTGDLRDVPVEFINVVLQRSFSCHEQDNLKAVCHTDRTCFVKTSCVT